MAVSLAVDATHNNTKDSKWSTTVAVDRAQTESSTEKGVYTVDLVGAEGSLLFVCFAVFSFFRGVFE